jgi:hypothetical protein
VIVLRDPMADAGLRFFQIAIFSRPDFLFLQAAMEPFDVACCPPGDDKPSAGA